MAVDIGSFDFAKVIQFMQASGFYDYLLPLLLIFAIVFAVLQKTKIFGTEGKGDKAEPRTNINLLVSLLVGFLLVAQQSIVQTINAFFPKVSLILVVILMGILVIALMSGKSYNGINGTLFGLAGIVVFIAIIYALISSVPGAGSFLSQDDIDSILTWALPLGIIGLVMYLLTRQKKDANKKYNMQKLAYNLLGKDDENK